MQAAIDPTPTAATALRDVRGPTMTSQMKLANGMVGTRKRRSSTLSFHLAGPVSIKRFVLVIKLQHEREPNRDFGSCHGQNKDEHHLAVGFRPARARSDKCQTSGIEHDLDRHQDEK